MNWDTAAQRNRQVYFQGRLDKKLEAQKISLRDNLINLAGIPEDILIVKEKKDINNDTISTVMSGHMVSNIIFPVLKNVPVRKVSQEFGDGYTLTNLVSAYGEGSDKKPTEQKELTTMEITLPLKSDLEVQDKIVRVMVQEGKAVTVLLFDVLEVTSDFSNNAALTLHATIALSTKPMDLTKPLYQEIMTLAARRQKVGY